jgi:hypothetical protein
VEATEPSADIDTQPDTADGGHGACGEYRPLVGEPLTALAIPGAAFADRLGADIMVHGFRVSSFGEAHSLGTAGRRVGECG